YAYVSAFPATPMSTATLICVTSELGVVIAFWLTFLGVGRRHYQFPFFWLVGVVCNTAEAAMLQLTGGSESSFFFPYFLILFGIAALFPARLSWMVAAVVMSPLSFVASVHFGSAPAPAAWVSSNLILLADYAFIAAIANRVTTRIFFAEVE